MREFSVYGIIKSFESYHLDAKAYQSDLNTLLKGDKITLYNSSFKW